MKLTAKLLTSAYKSRVINSKLDKDQPQLRFYDLSFMNSLKIVLSQFSETYMLLMDYPSIRGRKLPYYAKNATWNLLYAYKDAHSQRLIDECPGDGVQDTSRLKSQCSNMTFADQSRYYNRMFQKVVHQGGDSEINYIKRFHNAKALSILVGNIYTEYQLSHTFLQHFHRGVRYSAQIVIHQA